MVPRDGMAALAATIAAASSLIFLNWKTVGAFFVLRWIWNCLLHI